MVSYSQILLTRSDQNKKHREGEAQRRAHQRSLLNQLRDKLGLSLASDTNEVLQSAAFKLRENKNDHPHRFHHL